MSIILLDDHPASVFVERIHKDFYATDEQGFIVDETGRKPCKKKIGRAIKHCFEYVYDTIIESCVLLYEELQGIKNLNLAKTEEEIIDVYKNGPKSCMFGIQGVMAYAHSDGDIAIAYTGPITRPSARAVVNTKRMEYLTVYGDARLDSILRSSGYTYKENFLNGLKLKKVMKQRHWNCEEYYLPYMDGDNKAIPHDDCFVVSEMRDNSFNGNSGTGTIRIMFSGEYHDLTNELIRIVECYEYCQCEISKMKLRGHKESLFSHASSIIENLLIRIKQVDVIGANDLICAAYSTVKNVQKVIECYDSSKTIFSQICKPE